MKGGEVLVRELGEFLFEKYNFIPQTKETTPPDFSVIDEFKVIRRNIRKLQKANEINKFRLICVGHSQGGLFLRYSIGLIYKSGFFHEKRGPFTPFV